MGNKMILQEKTLTWFQKLELYSIRLELSPPPHPQKTLTRVTL